MSGLLKRLAGTITRDGQRRGPGTDPLSPAPVDDHLDPLRSYSEVLAQARHRRGGLISRP